MKQQFQGARSPSQTNNMPFYNPQKDNLNPNNLNLYQNSNANVPNFIPNSNSKSFITRSNIMEPPKPGTNTSAYIKNPNEGPNPSPKFHNPVISPTSNFGNTNFPNFQPPFQAKSPTN